MGFGEEDVEVKHHFHPISRMHTVNMTITVYADLDHLIEVVFVRFLYCDITPLPFSYIAVWKEVTTHNAHLRIGEFHSTTLLGAE